MFGEQIKHALTLRKGKRGESRAPNVLGRESIEQIGHAGRESGKHKIEVVRDEEFGRNIGRTRRRIMRWSGNENLRNRTKCLRRVRREIGHVQWIAGSSAESGTSAEPSRGASAEPSRAASPCAEPSRAASPRPGRSGAINSVAAFASAKESTG